MVNFKGRGIHSGVEGAGTNMSATGGLLDMKFLLENYHSGN